MSKKPTIKAAPKAVDADVSVVGVAAVSQFIPCRQCGNPGGCSAAGKCAKGFK